jgi:uncharacterized RDD family membrane protein YckC
MRDSSLLESRAGAPTATFGGFWRRVAAFLIDGVVIGGVAYLAGKTFSADGAAIAAFAFFVIYSAGFEGSALQATPGKLAMGMRVLDVEGARMTWGRSLSRGFLKLVSAGSGGAGFAVAAFTPMKQAVHDLMASTVVVRTDVSQL